MTASALIALLLLASPDAGANQCHITAGKGDRVRKGGDVVVAKGEIVEDAIAVEGNVVVKSGAKVKSAVALHGSVIVEDGATVTWRVVAVGGRAQVSKQAKVGERQVSIDDQGLSIMSGDDGGKDLHISAALGGESLSRTILAKFSDKLSDCEIGISGK